MICAPRPASLILALVLAAAALLPGCGKQAARNETLAEVNGVPLKRAQLETELARCYGPLVLRDLADQAIAEQLARKQGLEVDPQRVDYLLEQEQVRAGGRKQLEQKLTKSGRTLDDLREELAHRALAEKLISAQVEVPEAEARAYYNDHKDEFKHGEMIKGRLMLLASRADAEAIHDILSDPTADFAGLAEAVSIDPGTKDEGGDMGWIERGDYASAITDAAFKLQPGQYTDIIEYVDGYAIVLVEARKPEGHQSFEDVRPTIESLIRREKEAQLEPTWAAEHRKQTDITVYDRNLRRAFGLVKGG